MAESHETLNLLWNRLHRMQLQYPKWVGLDDYSPATGVSFSVRQSEGFASSFKDQLVKRERLILRHLYQLLGWESPTVSELVPILVSCLSPTATAEVAGTVASSFRHHAEGVARVFFSRILSSAETPSDEGARERTDSFRLQLAAVDRLLGEVHGKLRGAVAEGLVNEFKSYLAWRSAGVSAGPLTGGGGYPASGATKIETVIVHGTFAASTTWWREPKSSGSPPSDNLWAHLKKEGISTLIGNPDEFSWSGGNSDPARQMGAELFVDWWRARGLPTLDVVAHSHGGNVVMMASALEPKMHIRNLVLLGTPARYPYVPRFHQTEQLTNVYSSNDMVQVPGSWGSQRGEGRTQSDHAAGTNLHLPYWSSVSAAVKSASHSDLHEPDFWDIHKLAELLK